MQHTVHQLGCYLADQGASKDDVCLTALVSMCIYSSAAIYIGFVLVNWIRARFPDPMGDYTGFVDVSVKTG